MFDGKGRKCASVGQVPHRYYFPVPPFFFRNHFFFIPNFLFVPKKISVPIFLFPNIFSYPNLFSYPNFFRKIFVPNFFFRTNIHNCGDCGDVDKLNLMLLYPSSQKHRHTSTVSTLIILDGA